MELYHYGIKRRSGRYPYGSGKRPYQDGSRRVKSVKELKSKYGETYNPADTEQEKKWASLLQEINTKSSDWYFNEGKSPAAKAEVEPNSRKEVLTIMAILETKKQPKKTENTSTISPALLLKI